MSALGVIALVLAILAFTALLFLAIMLPVRRRAHRLRDEIDEELGEGVRRRENANTFGLQSLGKSQMRGNGWLVLTDDELVFRMWVPDRETRIPLRDVTAVETPRSWLGKTMGSRLLCVRWRTAEGGEDAMAWLVKDLESWLADLGQPGPA